MVSDNSGIPNHILKVVQAVARLLGVNVVVDGVHRRYDRTLVYRLRIVDEKGGLTPRLKIGTVETVVELHDMNGKLVDAWVLVLLGNKIVGELNCFPQHTSVQSVAGAIADTVLESVSPNKLQVLDSTVELLKSNGFLVTNIDMRRKHVADTVMNTFYISASNTKGDLFIGLEVDNSIRMYVSVYIPDAKYLTGADVFNPLDKHPLLSNRRIGADIDYENSNVEVVVEPVTPDEVVMLIHTVQDVVNEVVSNKRKLMESIEPVDACALYLLGVVSDGALYDLLYETSGITSTMIEERAEKYIMRVLGGENPTSIAKLISRMYEEGKLTIDDWHIAVEGRRILDVVRKYTGGTTTYQVSTDESVDMQRFEDDILVYLLKYGNIDMAKLVKQSNRVPDRVIKSVLVDKELSSRYANLFIEDPDAWAKLSYRARTWLLSSLEMVRKARENDWAWVFEDPYLVAHALSRSSLNPAELTKALTELLPELIGSDFNVVQVGGEPFIKIANVILQVRRALSNKKVEVQGTVGTSSVGIVARGRTVNEAAKTILSNFMDTVLEYRELAKAMQTSKVKIKEYATPLFRVPVITVSKPGKELAIPLQPGITAVLRRHGIVMETEEGKLVA